MPASQLHLVVLKFRVRAHSSGSVSAEDSLCARAPPSASRYSPCRDSAGIRTLYHRKFRLGEARSAGDLLSATCQQVSSTLSGATSVIPSPFRLLQVLGAVHAVTLSQNSDSVRPETCFFSCVRAPPAATCLVMQSTHSARGANLSVRGPPVCGMHDRGIACHAAMSIAEPRTLPAHPAPDYRAMRRLGARRD